MATRKPSPAKKWKPASDQWTSAFAAAVAAMPQFEQRKMFGYPAVFVGGNMAAGLHEAGLVLRLAAEDREALLHEGGTPFAPMPGRVMRDFVVAPQTLAGKTRELRQWLDRSAAYASSMPAKASRKKASKKRKQ